MASQGKRNLKVDGMYRCIMQEFPFIKTCGTGWKDLISHLLSKGQFFQKVERHLRRGRKRGCYWEIVPEKRAALRDEVSRLMQVHKSRMEKSPPLKIIRSSTPSDALHSELPHLRGTRLMQSELPKAKQISTPLTLEVSSNKTTFQQVTQTSSFKLANQSRLVYESPQQASANTIYCHDGQQVSLQGKNSTTTVSHRSDSACSNSLTSAAPLQLWHSDKEFLGTDCSLQSSDTLSDLKECGLIGDSPSGVPHEDELSPFQFEFVRSLSLLEVLEMCVDDSVTQLLEIYANDRDSCTESSQNTTHSTILVLAGKNQAQQNHDFTGSREMERLTREDDEILGYYKRGRSPPSPIFLSAVDNQLEDISFKQVTITNYEEEQDDLETLTDFNCYESSSDLQFHDSLSGPNPNPLDLILDDIDNILEDLDLDQQTLPCASEPLNYADYNPDIVEALGLNSGLTAAGVFNFEIADNMVNIAKDLHKEEHCDSRMTSTTVHFS